MYQVSGLNNEQIQNIFNTKNLLPPKSIIRVTGESQYKFGFPSVGMSINYVPTYISTCPHCGHNNKWATTGLIVPITCENCKQLYAMFKPDFKLDNE